MYWETLIGTGVDENRRTIEFLLYLGIGHETYILEISNFSHLPKQMSIVGGLVGAEAFSANQSKPVLRQTPRQLDK